MDISTVVGLVMGVGLVLTSILMGEGGLVPFIDIPSVMITIGGATAAVMMNFTLGKVLGVFGVIKNCFFAKLPTTNEVINQLGEFAATVRRDGLLALENRLEEVHDRFLKRGLEMVIGGTSAEDLQRVLETEVSYIEERHKTGKKIVDAMGAAAPAFGMIGTLIGLVQMLRSLDDPSKIGGGMAVALLTTLYGAIVANLFCIPLAGKLEVRSKDEIMVRELMVVGLVSLVEGQTPRVVQERLQAFLSPGQRPNLQTAA